MLAAQLHHKLSREEESLEDLLTSNVFGAFGYVPFEDGILPFLQEARSETGNGLHDILSDVTSTKYVFWPWLQEADCIGAEPDVILMMEHADKKKTAILVECKYLSGKSSEAGEEPIPYDQLGREYDNLRFWAPRHGCERYQLLYVTSHIAGPWEEIRNSIRELEGKRQISPEFFWVSWRVIPRLFKNSPHKILRDVVEIIRGQDLTFFEGVDLPEHVLGCCEWGFTKQEIRLPWSLPDGFPYYRFSLPKILFRWDFLTIPPQYVFQKGRKEHQ